MDTITIKTLLQAPTNAEINKFKRDLEKKLGSIKVDTKHINLLNEKEISNYQKHMQNMLTTLRTKYGKVLDVSGIQKQVQEFNSALSEFGENALNKENLDLQLETLTVNIESTAAALKAAEKNADSFGDKLLSSASKFVKGKLFDAFKDGIDYINKLDVPLNKIRIATGKNQAEVNSLAMAYNKLAREMSASTIEVASEASNLFNQGFNASEVEARMKPLLEYAKISGLSFQDSNRIITETAHATGESIKKITDLFAGMGSISATGPDELGRALQSMANSVQDSGISIEKSVSWITAIPGAAQESAGAMAKAIARYEEIKTTGANSEDSTRLYEIIDALNQIGITATGASGQLRPFRQIMDEVGAQFNSFSANEQFSLAETLFGSAQKDTGVALLQNYQQALSNYQTALYSVGSAEQQFGIYQESTQAKFDTLKASVEGLWQSFGDSGLIKAGIDILTKLIKLLDNDFVRLIGTIALVSAGIYGLGAGLGALSKTTLWNVVSTTALTLSQKGLAAAATSLWATLSVSPLFWVVAATAAVVGLVKVFDFLNTSIAEQRENVEKAKQAYEETSNKIRSLYEELIANKERINELTSKGNLETNESNELSHLKLSNEELRLRIALLEKEEEIKSRKLVEEQEKLYNKQFGDFEFSENQINKYLQNSAGTLTWEENNISALIAAYKQFSDLKKEALISGNLQEVEHFDQLLSDIQLNLINNSKELQNTKDVFATIKKPTAEQQQILSQVEQGLLLINQIVIPDKFKELTNGANKALRPIEEIDKVVSSAFSNMSKIANDASDELKSLNSAIADVEKGNRLSADTVLDLMEKYNLSSTAISKNADGYTIELSALENVRKAKIQTAIDAIESEKKQTKVMEDEVGARLKNYGLEISQLKNIATVKSALAKHAHKAATEEFNKNYSDISFIKGQDVYNKLYEKYLKEANAEVESSQKVLDDIAEVEKTSEILIELLKTPASGADAPSTGNKSDYTPSTEQKALKELLNSNKITLQQYYIRLLALEKSQYSDYADKSAAQLESMLRSKDEKVAKRTAEFLALKNDISSSGNNIFSNALSSTKKLFDEGSWSIDKYISYLESLQKVLKKLGIELNTEQIRELNSAINQARMDKISDSSQQFNNALENSNNRISEMEFRLKLVSNTSQNQAAIIENEILKEKQSQLANINKELLKYNDAIKKAKTADEKDLYQKQIQSLLSQSQALEEHIYNYYFKLRNEAVDELKNAEAQRHEQALYDLNEESERYREFIDNKLRENDRLYADEDYNKNISRQNKDIQAKQAELNALSLDDSAEAMARKAQLNAELLDLQQKKDDTVREHHRSEEKNLLNELLRLKEKDIKSKKELEDENYKNFQTNLDSMLNGANDFYINQENISKMSIDNIILYYETLNVKASGVYDNLIAKLTQLKLAGLGNPMSTNFMLSGTSDTPPASTSKPQDPVPLDTSTIVQMHSFLEDNGHNVEWKNGSVYIDNKKIDMAGSGIVNIQGRHMGTIADIKKLLEKYVIPFESGGYTGDWSGNDGRFALLHKKELVLNQLDTKNLLKAIDITKTLAPLLNSYKLLDLSALKQKLVNLTLHNTIVAPEGIDAERVAELATRKIFTRINTELALKGI